MKWRSQKWPLWARKAFAPVLAKRRAALAKKTNDLEACDTEDVGMRRRLLHEAHHTMAEEEEPLTTPRELAMGEGEGEEVEGNPRLEGDAIDVARNFRELMEYSAANKKDRDADEEVMPNSGQYVSLVGPWNYGPMVQCPKYWAALYFCCPSLCTSSLHYQQSLQDGLGQLESRSG